jgi:uncharacterized membrane protein YwzB
MFILFVKENYASNEKVCLTFVFVLIASNFAFDNLDLDMEYLP